MVEIYPDIPRIYTAVAEVTACLLFAVLVRPKQNFKRLAILAAVFYVWQGIYLEITKGLPVSVWIPCMLGALLFMFIFMLYTLKLGPVPSAYLALRAFILAEFAASIEWQIVCFFNWEEAGNAVFRIAALLLTYGGVFAGMYFLERPAFRHVESMEISVQEFWTACLISLLVFTLSNLSFVTTDALFTSAFQREVFNTRTLVDLAGAMVLFAFQNRMTEVKAERELAAMNVMLKTQYDKYRSYQESIDLINMKYHDLKHQLEGMRAGMTQEERSEWVDYMEQELQAYSPRLQTGSQVLDAVLDSKMVACINRDIKFTCVADGALLSFLHVADLCTIFGNALDNAIESTALIEEPEKRLIHLTVSAKKNFVYIFIENYCCGNIGMKNGYPVTTKTDKKNHGFGIKSICYTAEKYGGTVTFGVQNCWFSLKILIPLPKSS